MNAETKIRDFKTNAWKPGDMASSYAKRVNDTRTVSDIDLQTQIMLLEKYQLAPARIADIGCGTGALSLRLASLGYHVTGIDISSEMLAQMKKRSKGNNLDALEANIFSLPEPKLLYDAAVSRWVLPHFADWAKILGPVSKVLKKGGVFIFDFPSGEHTKYSADIGRVDKKSLKYDHSSTLEEVDPYYYYGAQTDDEIVAALEQEGFVMEQRLPYGLLNANSLLFGDLSPKDIEARARILNFGVSRFKLIRSLIEQLERAITPHLPNYLVHGSFVVARRV